MLTIERFHFFDFFMPQTFALEMKYSTHKIVFQEIPDEISLALHIVGCPLRCQGCHSSSEWNPQIGRTLDAGEFMRLLDRYVDRITCVLFLGGEWHESLLLELLSLTQKHQLKTALYTGLELTDLSSDLINQLDYIKTGPYIATLGGLSSPTSNQRLINLKTRENLNHHFYKDGIFWNKATL